jgi:hypothetical protein
MRRPKMGQNNHKKGSAEPLAWPPPTRPDQAQLSLEHSYCFLTLVLDGIVQPQESNRGSTLGEAT